MPSETDFNDDYVARLLAEDAKKTSHKYAAQGLSAFAPKCRAADLPKPNTRFLSHIVREADHHNAALKRKEEKESERRLRALRDTDEPPRKRLRADESDQRKRSRMLKDVLGAAQSRSDGRHRSAVTGRSHPSRDRQEHARRQHSRERHRSPDNSRPSRRKRNEKSPAIGGTVYTHQGRRHSNTDSLARSQLDGSGGKVEREDAGPVQKRGRGAHRAKSSIDNHFTKGYDPSQDVSLDSDHVGDDNDDDDDWDLALEAMRDRAKWKQNQASRMREAGFDETEIPKWEKGRSEGDPSSVKWSRKGEVREWDAGKIEQ